MTDTRPAYDEPPVSEVSIAVQYDDITGVLPFGFIASNLADRSGYTNVTERAPIPPMPTRDQLVQGEAGVQISFQDTPPTPLLWLQDETGAHLIQLQHDRLALNWRRTADDVEYPSFDDIGPRFEALYAEFLELAGQVDRVIKPNAFEVTYVNTINPAQSPQRLIAPWSGRHSDEFLATPRLFRCVTEYPLPDDLGVLTIDVQPGRRRDTGADITVLRLVARGWPSTEKDLGMPKFLAVAHDWIVRGFTSFTTPTMHKLWKRTN